MPAGGLLALLDDVASLTKIATQKVSGVVGDDLALNAKTMIGIAQDRELPLIKQVAIGSFKNKILYLMPAAVIMAVLSPALMHALLVFGGIFLCFEGVEKLLHRETPASRDNIDTIAPESGTDLEKQKINSANKTDFILSAEIMVLALNTMLDKPWYTQLLTLTLVSIAMTVGVYGAVAGLLRTDNLGLYLMEAKGGSAKIKHAIGRALVNSIPYIMKTLSVVGTFAMFSVGGGIVLHSIPPIAHEIENFSFMIGTFITATAGVVVGFIAVGFMKIADTPIQKTKPFFARWQKKLSIKR